MAQIHARPAWYHAHLLRAAFASFSAFLALVAALGCATRPPPAPPKPKPAPSSAPPKPKPPVWARFDEARSWPPSAEAFPSRGHGAGIFTIEVHVSPEARERYQSLLPGAALPEGSVVAAFHRDAETGRPGPVYVMEKRAEGWSFRSLDAEGRAVEQSLELCRRCHSEAPADWVFGVPKARRKPPQD